MSKNTVVTLAMLAKISRQANLALDSLRQLDNLMLYTFDNPEDLDKYRDRCLTAMRHIHGLCSEVNADLDAMTD